MFYLRVSSHNFLLPMPIAAQARGRVRRWRFVVNNYTEEDITQLKNAEYKYIVFGQEIAPTTGTPHLQGYVEFDKAMTLVNCKDKLSQRANFLRADLSHEVNRTYATKDATNVFEKGTPVGDNYGKNYKKTLPTITADTMPLLVAAMKECTTWTQAYQHPVIIPFLNKSYPFIKNMWEHREKSTRVREPAGTPPPPALDIPLLPWQASIVYQLEQLKERQILWVVDTEGNSGKSFLVKWLLMNKECMAGTMDHVSSAYKWRLEHYIVYDLPRARGCRIDYAMLESFCAGHIESTKYHGETKMITEGVFRYCKQLVLANAPPPIDNEVMTADRFVVVDIQDTLWPARQQQEFATNALRLAEEIAELHTELMRIMDILSIEFAFAQGEEDQQDVRDQFDDIMLILDSKQEKLHELQRTVPEGVYT